MSARDDDVPMRRMPIVGSDQAGGPQGLATMPRCRMLLVIAAVVSVVGALIVSGTVRFPSQVRGDGSRGSERGSRWLTRLRAQGGLPPPEGQQTEWPIGLELYTDQMYYLERTRDLTVTVPELNITETLSTTVLYRVTKFGGNTAWSYLRFQVVNYSAVLTTGGAQGRWDFLEEAIVNHTFTANLTHGGCVSFRDDTNIRATILLVLKQWDRQYPHEDMEQAAMSEDGNQMVDDVEVSVFNYMLASPANRSVRVNDSWTRTVDDLEEPVEISYQLIEHARGLQMPRPSNLTAPDLGNFSAVDPGWLVVQMGSSVQMSNTGDYLKDIISHVGLSGQLENPTGVVLNSTLRGELVLGDKSSMLLDGRVELVTNMSATFGNVTRDIHSREVELVRGWIVAAPSLPRDCMV